MVFPALDVEGGGGAGEIAPPAAAPPFEARLEALVLALAAAALLCRAASVLGTAALFRRRPAVRLRTMMDTHTLTVGGRLASQSTLS